MTRSLRLLPEAREEYDADAEWYEDQQPGLGVNFAAKVREVFLRVSRQPRLHAKVYRDVRKAVVQRFPYIVLYPEEPTEILVIAVFHASRDPNDWKSRL